MPVRTIVDSTGEEVRHRSGLWGRRHRAGLLTAVVLMAFGLGLAACSSSSGTTTTTTTTTASSTTTSTAATTTTSGVAATPASTSGTPPLYEVTTGTVPGLGTVLVAGNGFTLYLFVPDKQSGVSTCYGGCATAWPPLLLTGTDAPVYGPGVKPGLLGSTKRTDGTLQVTYNGWPLYLWQGDSVPGQATGQGIDSTGGLWYVLNPAGKEITAKAT
jgi:predicted lipoprotein with Yx(FWY)xxD motif